MSKLEQQVMASVAVIYAARSLTSATALKVYVLALSLGGVMALVSVSDVAANTATVAHGGVWSLTAYLFAAVLGTTLVVQLALAAGAAALISLFAPVFRTTLGRRLFA